MTAATDTHLDERLEAELRDAIAAPCEAKALHVCLIHGAHVRQCENEATWAMRGTCEACGYSDMALLCDEHAEDARRLIAGKAPNAAVVVCFCCRVPLTAATLSLERI